MGKNDIKGGSKTTPADKRFAHIKHDPRFKKETTKVVKAKVDARFQEALKDKDFSTKVAIDAHGIRRKTKNGMKELYEVSEEEEDEQVGEVLVGEDSEESTDVGSTDDELELEDSDAEALADGYLPGSLVNTAAPIVTEATRRLALMHMDWTHLRSVDLLAVLKSVCPADGHVSRVAIYPSDFGKEQLAKEAKLGPAGLWDAPQEGDDDDEEEGSMAGLEFHEIEDEDEDGDEDDGDEEDAEELEEDYDSDVDIEEMMGDAENGDEVSASGLNVKKLKEYELGKLKYYYAIVDCDSSKTALSIYHTLDGMEYETTANVFDVRFVPDSQKFNESELRDDAKTVPANHRPPAFVTQALQQTDVKCTWEQEDPIRKKLMRAPYEQAGFKEDDVSAFLASGSEDEAAYQTDVPISESEADDDDDLPASDDEAVKPGKAVKGDKGKTVTLLKRRARSEFADLLAELHGSNSKYGQEKARKEKLLKKANKASDDEADETDDDENDSDDDSSDQDIVFAPALQSFAETVAGKKKAREEAAKQDRLSVWEKQLQKMKDNKKARKDASKTASKIEDIKQGKVQKGSLYDDDETAVDMNDDFFKGAFDDEEYVAPGEDVVKPAVSEKKKGKKEKESAAKEKDDDSQRGYSVTELVKEHQLKKEVNAKKRNTRRQRDEELVEDMLQQQSQASKTEKSLQREDFDDLINQKKSSKKRKVTADRADSLLSDTFQVNVNDSRFGAIHDEAAFAIDPNDSQFRSTEGSERLLQETQKRRRDQVRQQEQAVRERKALIRQGAPTISKPSAEKKELDGLVNKLKAAAKLPGKKK